MSDETHLRKDLTFMRPHEKLNVWQRAVDFVVRLYRATASFPPEEKFGLTSQIRRAAVSVPANIAEGAGLNQRRNLHISSQTRRALQVNCRLSS
jgi:hypothetical protein